MSDWQLLRTDKLTGVQTWGWFEQDGNNPEIGKMHIKEVMSAAAVNELLGENHHIRSEFKGYKELYTPFARIPENLYWHLRKKSGEQDGVYDRKYFEKLLNAEYKDFRTDRGGKVM